MKNVLIGFMVFVSVSCATFGYTKQPTIYLYGETHGNSACYDEEFERWQALYKKGARDLFLELSYSCGKLLNEWMQEEDNAILDFLYESIRGTQAHTLWYYNFFEKIKLNCPKTIFHGVDVEHQGDTIAAEYLKRLEMRGLKESTEYKLVLENIADGKAWVEEQNTSSWVSRENSLVKNFIREYNELDSSLSVMGIFGSLHTCFDSLVPQIKKTMASFLLDYYTPKGIVVESYNIANVHRDYSTQNISIGNKNYKVEYLDNIFFPGFGLIKFYRLQDTTDFLSLPYLGDNMPVSNYPTNVSTGECFCLLVDGLDSKQYTLVYRCDGNIANGVLWTHRVFEE